MSLQNRYRVLKAVTIVLGALSIPWSTFVGFAFGEGRYFTASVALLAQTVVALVDGYIWFWVLENMRDKMKDEGCQQCAGNAARNPAPRDLAAQPGVSLSQSRSDVTQQAR